MKNGFNLKNKNVTVNKPIKVIDVEKDDKLSKDAKRSIAIVGISTLIAAILLGASALSINKTNNNYIENSNDEITKQKQYVIYSDIVEDINKKEIKKVDTSFNTNQTEISENVTYSNINKFYNHIVENRIMYGQYAESFQSEDDVRYLVNYIHNFDEFHKNDSLNTNIKSREEFDKIISDYYKSCVKNDVQGELNILFEEYPTYKTKLEESEKLAFNLKNGKGKDYSIANDYYTWFGKNLCDDRTNIDITVENAPLIEILRWQYEEYRNVGNMLNARKYQKNDSLPIESVNIYYADKAPEGVEVIEEQNAYTCPDWGIDNVVSPTEEDTEKKLVKKENNKDRLFKRVEESFNTINNRLS